MQIDTLEHKLAAALKEIDELNTRLVAQADEFKTDQEQLQDKLAASVERARLMPIGLAEDECDHLQLHWRDWRKDIIVVAVIR